MIKIALIGHGFSLVCYNGMDLRDTCFYTYDGGMIDGPNIPDLFETIKNDDRTVFNHQITHDFLLSSEMTILEEKTRPLCIRDLNPQENKYVISDMEFYLFKTTDTNENHVVILIPAKYRVGVKLSWIKKHVYDILESLKISKPNKKTEIVYHWLACMSMVYGKCNEVIRSGCNEGNLTSVEQIVG